VLTIEYCIALPGLPPEAVTALEEDDHLPDIIAAEPGNYLVRSEMDAACCVPRPRRHGCSSRYGRGRPCRSPASCLRDLLRDQRCVTPPSERRANAPYH
jgi:hypothetical protein